MALNICMKKIIYSSVIILFVLVACHKKSVPVITARSTEPVFTSPDTLHSAPDMEAGRLVFTNRCGSCHGLPETEKYTVKRWETIMVSMAPRARLDKMQAANVSAYVRSHAKIELNQ